MALLTLTEYKSYMGVQSGNTRDDAQVRALLEVASKAVETYAGRDFDTTDGVPATRNFLYDGSGFLDIDDCTAVTSVTASIPNGNPYVLEADEYTVMPDGGPVAYYLIMHGGSSPFAVSPEMGFTRNLDKYPIRTQRNPTLAVTATWGWPDIPEDVKLATALTVRQFLTSSGGGAAEGLTAEAIEGWSRSWGGRAGVGMTALAIPNRARDLLAAYQRVFV
jgi:hypothetical protein